jgi:hypothetical protein
MQEQQQTLTFKAKLGEEIRRFSVPASTEWKDIVGKINNIFSIGNHERISVKYEDDEEELVTIDSTQELEEVKRMFSNQCIRLTITKVAGSSLSATAPPRDNSENVQESPRNWRQSGKRKEWKRRSNSKYDDIPQEELIKKLDILQERGFKCKWKNIKMLKMNNGDVEKVCEIYLERKNRNNKYAEEIKVLQEKGFVEPVINFKLLKRYDGNVEKVVDILTKARKFEGNNTTSGQDNSCQQWIIIRLLIKYDGNVEEVEKVWLKKQDKFLQKAQKKREKQVNKSECKWKNREKKCGKGEKDYDCPISRAWKKGCGQKSECGKDEKDYNCPISRAWNRRGCGQKSECDKGEKDWNCPIRSKWCKKDKHQS